MADFGGHLQRPQYRSGAKEHGSGDRFGSAVPVSNLVARRPATVRGYLGDVRTVEGLHGPRCEAVLDDATGSVVLVFLGRRSIPGLVPGTALEAQGTPRAHRGRTEILNPRYELISSSSDLQRCEEPDDTRSDT
jgi:hypothetical protein